MHRVLDSPAMTAPATGAAASFLAVAGVTAAIFLFRGFVPVLSLGVLYIFAVLPVAVEWGLAFSLPVAVGSMLAFNFFFLPPVHTFTLTDSENWFSLAVYSGTAIVVERARSELQAPDGRGRAEAEGGGAPRGHLDGSPAGASRSGRARADRAALGRGARHLRDADRSRAALATVAERDLVPARDRGAHGGTDLRASRGGAVTRDAAAIPARAGVASRRRRRPRASGAPGPRSRGAATQRRAQDRPPAGRLARPPLAADSDLDGGRGPPEREPRTRSCRPGAAARDDRGRVRAPRAPGRQPARPLSPPGRCRGSRPGALDGRPADRPGARPGRRKSTGSRSRSPTTSRSSSSMRFRSSERS